MTITQELSMLKPTDGINGIETLSNGYQFINTYGHGYLFVPKTDKLAKEAATIAIYGYRGELGYYLEEDSEASAFLALLKGDREPMNQYLARCIPW